MDGRRGVRSVDDLTMYVYGLLEGSQERAIQEHVATCASCTEISERIGAEHRLLEVALAREIPGSADRAKTAEEVLDRRYAPSSRIAWNKLLAVLRPAAGVAFIAGLFLLLFISAGLPRPADGKLIGAPPTPALMVTAEPAHPRELQRPAPGAHGPEAFCDLKIVMTWDGRANVDLEVQEPGGGHASMDHRNRYGLETYVVPRLKGGIYRVGAQLRGPVRSKVKFLVILFEGTDAEERHEATFVLEKSGEQKFIRDLVITR
jgi:hypothetical protein